MKQWETNGGKPTKCDWFRRGGVTNIITVTASKESVLAKRIQSVFDSVPGPTGSKTKVIRVSRKLCEISPSEIKSFS